MCSSILLTLGGGAFLFRCLQLGKLLIGLSAMSVLLWLMKQMYSGDWSCNERAHTMVMILPYSETFSKDDVFEVELGANARI